MVLSNDGHLDEFEGGLAKEKGPTTIICLRNVDSAAQHLCALDLLPARKRGNLYFLAVVVHQALSFLKCLDGPVILFAS